MDKPVQRSDDASVLSWVVAALNARKGDWAQIAERAGVPYSTLAKVAGGFTRNPRFETIERLRAALLAARV